MTSISPALLAFSRGGNTTPPRHLGTRYSTDGTFLSEPGNTVVCHTTAGTPTHTAILAVRERLMRLPQADRLAFTHASSLHMTIFQGIIEYRRNRPYWPNDMPLDTPIDVMTAHYRDRLKDFAPLGPFRARITDVTPEGLTLEGDSPNDRHCLQAWRDAFADIFGYRHPDHDHYEFHVTFAYIVDWLDDSVLPAWQEALMEQLAYLKDQAPIVDLDPPAFCAFEDMNHFEELVVFDAKQENRKNGMTKLTLYVGNKNYSSWSLRPWLALEACGVPFEDVVIPFDFPAGNPKFRDISPTGRVPVLHHGDVRVWESLAIIEYAAELFPQAGLWPEDPAERAVARSYSMEMLSGFRALRGACPMNIRREKRAINLPNDVRGDVERIETIWREAVARSGGPFLFGRFTAADAMFAPVVNRFEVYDLTRNPGSLAYMDAVKTHPAFAKWQEAALKEPWIVPEDEA